MKSRCVAALLACAACASEPTASLRVDVQVAVDDGAGQPIAGAAITSPAGELGITDSAGSVALQLHGEEGQEIPIAVRCPPDSRARPPRIHRLTLRRLMVLGAGATATPRRRIGFTCLPTTRSHLLVVRTDRRAALPVIVTGKPAAVTDRAGVAQLVLRGTAGEEVEVVIDTTAHPELRPAMPSRRLRLPEASRVLVFDQRFSERTAPGTQRRRRHVAGPRRL